jgi:8-oxo-dGTP pyrophosphatase MutT (NUDIX family)
MLGGWHAVKVPMSAYLSSIRAKVGHDLLVLPAVSVFVVDMRADGPVVLLCKNSGQTQWESIGGMVEPHEHPKDAALRELAEEAGLVAGDLTLLGCVGGPEYGVGYPNGDEVSYVTSVYVYIRFSVSEPADGSSAYPLPAPTPDNVEITDVRWFSRADLETADLGRFVRGLLAEFSAALFADGKK